MFTSWLKADELAMRAEPQRLDFGNKENKQIHMPASLHGVLHKCMCAASVHTRSLTLLPACKITPKETRRNLAGE